MVVKGNAVRWRTRGARRSRTAVVGYSMALASYGSATLRDVQMNAAVSPADETAGGLGGSNLTDLKDFLPGFFVIRKFSHVVVVRA